MGRKKEAEGKNRTGRKGAVKAEAPHKLKLLPKPPPAFSEPVVLTSHKLATQSQGTESGGGPGTRDLSV